MRESPAKSTEKHRYPTPIPTSSTLIPSSSPPPPLSTRRPLLARTVSAFSERAPLTAVQTIELDEHGEPTLMGRSSNSSHFQLSTNKLISRVHVRAVYIPVDPPAPKKLHVECLGWNGLRVHCQGKAWELQKGDSFTTETEDVDVMIDVQDARVLLQWPRHENKVVTPTDSESAWGEEHSPSRGAAAATRNLLQSPLRQEPRLQSPVSPSPAVHAVFASSPPLPAPVKVFEDEPHEEDEPTQLETTHSTQLVSQSFPSGLKGSFSSTFSDPHDFSDHNEENDPIIHSFGPFGANLMPRMDAITTSDSPRRPLDPLKESSISPQRHNKPLQDLSASPQHRNSREPLRDTEGNSVINHIINQLAYSSLASTPLSTLMDNLPGQLRAESPGCKENGGLTIHSLRTMLDATQCVGEVSREGKDAAGKALESEYYYIPEADTDEKRRDAVVDGLRKPGLRACRKQHKVGSPFFFFLFSLPFFFFGAWVHQC